jgi:tetratricopeptide (TPR) repeat protein
MSGDREGPRKYARGYFGNEKTSNKERADTSSERVSRINDRVEIDSGLLGNDGAVNDASDDSVLYDDVTGRTYYLDEETGAYYYYNEEVGDYVYYEGDDEESTKDIEPATVRGQQSEARQRNSRRQREQLQADSSDAQSRNLRQQERQQRYSPDQPVTRPTNSAKREVAHKRKQRNSIIFIIVLALILIATVVAAVIISDAKSNDTYDAQMQIGVEHYKAGEYDKAEEAFNRALGFNPGDVKASIALADTFTATKKYKKAAILLENAKIKDPNNADIIDKLLTLYISHLDNITGANELIIECYNNKIDVQNELVIAAPVFDPAGGSFEEAKNVKITVSEGYTIHYTTNAKMPTEKNKVYKSSIKLRKSRKLTITAVGIAENGLYTWPGSAVFAIDIQYMTNSQSIDFVGSSAKKIMNSIGPLYYNGSDEGSLYYNASDSNSILYRFDADSLDMPEPEPTEDGEPVEPVIEDPERYPLKSSAVCTSISMKIDDYVPQLSGTISVVNLMSGLSIENYKVAVSDADGENHLYYSQNGIAFDYTLKNKTTVSMGGMLTVTRK